MAPVVGHVDRLGLICVGVGVALAAAAGLLRPVSVGDSPVVLKAGCPAVVPGTSNAAEDYADMVVWNQTSFIQIDALPRSRPVTRPSQVQLDARLGSVSCSLTDWSSTGGLRLASQPWPDGTASGLAVGSAIWSIQGVEPHCALAATDDGGVHTYVAADMQTDWSPIC